MPKTAKDQGCSYYQLARIGHMLPHVGTPYRPVETFQGHAVTEYVSMELAAELLGVSRRTVYRLVADGYLTTRGAGTRGNAWTVHVRSMLEYVNALARTPGI